MNNEYEVYDTGDELPWELRPSGAPTEDEAAPWAVMVEYSRGGESKPPTRLEFPATGLTSRQEAQAHARQAAFDFRPPDPWSEKARRVYRVGDEFVTELDGAMSTFHFRTSAVQCLAER